MSESRSACRTGPTLASNGSAQDPGDEIAFEESGNGGDTYIGDWGYSSKCHWSSVADCSYLTVADDTALDKTAQMSVLAGDTISVEGARLVERAEVVTGYANDRDSEPSSEEAGGTKNE